MQIRGRPELFDSTRARADGARVELLQRSVEFRTPDPGSGLITAFDHYGYQVEDLDDAGRFFSETVGMTPDATGHDRDTSAASYAIGADVLRLEASPSPGFSHIALRVADVERALATLAFRGVTPVGLLGATGDGVLLDPDGVRVVLGGAAPRHPLR